MLLDKISESRAMKDAVSEILAGVDSLQSVTVRLPTELVNNLDELLGETEKVSRTDLITVFVRAGVDEMQRQLESSQRHEDIFCETDSENERRYFLLNTNSKNFREDHLRMIQNGEASAMYGNWKKLITKLKAGDIVFLYHSGVGIRGYGEANGKVTILPHNGNPGEMYTQKLDKYVLLDKPINAKRMKELAGRKLKFMGTLNNLRDAGPKILEALESEINTR